MDNNIRITVLHMPVYQLIHHPDNPRKEFGDLSKLTESIRKKGIMQNLTIIPTECRELPAEEQPTLDQINMNGKFLVLIGNRRMEAAKQAGVEKLPCRIVTGLSKKDQIAIMLEENMQRNDLSISEQANSFQLMLDLGDTVDGIQEKTGFSKSTIYHRLNIAKLDPGTLEEKVKDESFQLSFGDMYALEKIESVEKRNEVLKNATDSQNLRYLIENAVQEIEKERRLNLFIGTVKKLGIPKAPKGTKTWSYDGNPVESFSLSPMEREFDQKIKDIEKLTDTEPLVWLEEYGWVYILEKRKQEEEKREPSPEKLERKKRNENSTELKAQCSHIVERMKEVVNTLVTDQIGSSDDKEKHTEALWEIMVKYDAVPSYETLWEFFEWDEPEKDDEEEYERIVEEKTASLSITDQMFIFAWDAINYKSSAYYDGSYDKKDGKALMEMADILKEYGLILSDTERSVLDGSSPLYTKEDGND